MRKQIIFFATPLDYERAFSDLRSKGVIILDQHGEKVRYEDALELCSACYHGQRYGFGNMYLTLEGLNIRFFNNNGEKMVDFLQSEVIVFSPCARQPKTILDTSIVDDQFCIGGYVVINDSAKYEKLMSEYMKAPVYIPNPHYHINGFEHGRFWISTEHLGDDGDSIKICQRLISLFDWLRKYIKKHYRLSTNHFGYIGIDAYNRMLQGSYVPCSGSVVIPFDTSGQRDGFVVPSDES